MITLFQQVQVSLLQVMRKQIFGKLTSSEKGHVIKVKAETFWYNDPYTLDFMRKDLKKKLMDAK